MHTFAKQKINMGAEASHVVLHFVMVSPLSVKLTR